MGFSYESNHLHLSENDNGEHVAVSVHLEGIFMNTHVIRREKRENKMTAGWIINSKLIL